MTRIYLASRYYADPPYLGPESLYRLPFGEADHVDLLNALAEHPGPVVLSGYASALYDGRLTDWDRHEKRTHTQRKLATEVLWIRADEGQQALGLESVG